MVTSLLSSSSSPCLISGRANSVYRGPKASISLSVAAFRKTPSSLITASSSITFNSSFFLGASTSLSNSFSGLSIGAEFECDSPVTKGRWRGLVVRASKYQLCQTKRNRSRKSLARTHGFRKRMMTASGRAVIKRRRAKGRKVLCTRTNPSSGKR